MLVFVSPMDDSPIVIFRPQDIVAVGVGKHESVHICLVGGHRYVVRESLERVVTKIKEAMDGT